MPFRAHVRRLAALLCVALLLFAAFSPAASGLAFTYVPFFTLLALLIALAVRPPAGNPALHPAPCLTLRASRAP